MSPWMNRLLSALGFANRKAETVSGDPAHHENDQGNEYPRQGLFRDRDERRGPGTAKPTEPY